MERDTTINTISIRQLGTLLVLALLPLGTEVLPSRLSQAGGAAWLCPLGAGGLLLALVALWGRWITLGEDLLRTLEQQKGRKVLRGFALVLLAWGFFLTGAQGARIGERLAQSLRASPLLLTAAVLAALPKGCLIVDLASKPGGTDFAAARRLGHTALHALSLPTVWAPETAGEALARTVQAILQEREGTV